MEQAGQGKAIGSGVAAAAASIVLWILHQYAHVDLPIEIQGALLTVLVGCAGWFSPHGVKS